MGVQLGHRHRCHRLAAKRNLVWLNTKATPPGVCYVQDLTTPPDAHDCVALVRCEVGEVGPAPEGCTCAGWYRHLGHHTRKCKLVAKPKPAADADEAKAPSSKPEATKAPGKAAPSSSKKTKSTKQSTAGAKTAKTKPAKKSG